MKFLNTITQTPTTLSSFTAVIVIALCVTYLAAAGTSVEQGRSFPKAVAYICVCILFGVPISAEVIITIRIKRKVKSLSRTVCTNMVIIYLPPQNCKHSMQFEKQKHPVFRLSDQKLQIEENEAKSNMNEVRNKLTTQLQIFTVDFYV